jgi:hypothetical protein
MRERAGFAARRARCASDPKAAQAALTRSRYRAAAVVSAKDGTIRDITPGGVVKLLTPKPLREATMSARSACSTKCCTRWVPSDPNAPAALRHLRVSGQKTPEELIDQYQLTSCTIRYLVTAYQKGSPAESGPPDADLERFTGTCLLADLLRSSRSPS